MRVTKKCNEYFSKPVTGAFEQVSIVLATFVFILWNGYYSESSAHESLAESYIFDYEVEVLYTKINTAAVNIKYVI